MASATTDVDMTSKSETGSAPGDDVTQILSESRTVRVVLYSSTPAETEHRFWIDPDVTFGGVAKALAEMYPSQELVVLQANWGPRPSWTESHPDSLIGSTCRVLYAILKDQAKPYTVGVVRTSLSDYPIPIYVPASKSSMTLLEAVIASYPKLTGQVKSIVLHLGDHDLQDAPWGDDFAKGQPYPAAPFLIATVDEPSKEFLASSLYEPFSFSSPKASTSSNSDGLIPPLLQISFAECKLLVQRAYELDVFPLQMIHLSEAIFHVIISLARSLTPVFENASSSIGAALSAEDDLADHLRVAPLLCRQLEELLNTANGIMDNLELGGFNREGAQHAIEKIFATLCGDLPGAVTVRCSEKDFERFGSIDCDGLDTLPLDTLDVKTVKTTYSESIMDDRRVANVDSMMDLDYDSDVRNLPDPSSWRSPSGKGGISEAASTLRYPDIGETNPTAAWVAHSRTFALISEAYGLRASPPASRYFSPHSSPRALPPGGRSLSSSPHLPGPEVIDAEGDDASPTSAGGRPGGRIKRLPVLGSAGPRSARRIQQDQILQTNPDNVNLSRHTDTVGGRHSRSRGTSISDVFAGSGSWSDSPLPTQVDSESPVLLGSKYSASAASYGASQYRMTGAILGMPPPEFHNGSAALSREHSVAPHDPGTYLQPYPHSYPGQQQQFQHPNSDQYLNPHISPHSPYFGDGNRDLGSGGSVQWGGSANPGQDSLTNIQTLQQPIYPQHPPEKQKQQGQRNEVDERNLADAFMPGSFRHDPVLRFFLDLIRRCSFYLEDEHEPLLGTPEAEQLFAQVRARYPHDLRFTSRNDPRFSSQPFDNETRDSQSIFMLLTENNQCLICSAQKDRTGRALGHVRSDIGHRPYHCNCDKCMQSANPRRFCSDNLLDDHLKGQQVKQKCVYCHNLFRRGGMKRHLTSKHPEHVQGGQDTQGNDDHEE